jgi:hypothetical protein
MNEGGDTGRRENPARFDLCCSAPSVQPPAEAAEQADGLPNEARFIRGIGAKSRIVEIIPPGERRRALLTPQSRPQYARLPLGFGACMLIRPALALVFCGLAVCAQASGADAALPSLALNPPPPPFSPWSGLYDLGQFTPAPGLGLAKPMSGDVKASEPGDSLTTPGTAKPPAARGAGLDYDLPNDVHLHLSIAGGAVAGGAIRH